MPNYKELSTGELHRLASQGDRDAYYWLGVDYKKRGDNQNAALWWEKAVKNLPVNHNCFRLAAIQLAFLHRNKLISQADINEAIRLFELAPNLDSFSTLLLGILYYDKQGQNYNPSRGMGLVEDAIKQLKEEDGNDEYLNHGVCFAIAGVYLMEIGRTSNSEYAWTKAMEYCEKTVARGPGTKEAEEAAEILNELERDLELLHKVNASAGAKMTREKFFKLFEACSVDIPEFRTNMYIDYDDFYSESEILNFTDSGIESLVISKDNRIKRLSVSIIIYQRDSFDRADAACRDVREMFPTFVKLVKVSEQINSYIKQYK